MKSTLALSFFLLGFANAACPNSCSGHGTCDFDDICTCYPGWGVGGKGGKGAGDCSERICPYELAWADGPTETGDTHNYAECANKGDCDRDSGQCLCFSGYEGKGCGRQSCPENCSGHGTCELMKDFTFGITYHDYNDGLSLDRSGLGTGGVNFPDFSWDTDRARACVCDGGWNGLKCDKRMCPMGSDPMEAIPSGLGSETRQKQQIVLWHSSGINSNFVTGDTFALQFTTLLNQTYVTQPIAWDSDVPLTTSIELALQKMPNKIIDEVTVVVDSSNDSNGVEIDIEFTGDTVQGKQHKLEVLVNACKEGCTPYLSGLTGIRTWHATTLSTVKIDVAGSHESYICGRRGKCDALTGLCQCYDGFAGDSCNIFHASV